MSTLSTVDISQIPLIDISPLLSGKNSEEIAKQIRAACINTGFFYIIGHGIDEGLQKRLEQLSRQFFAQDIETKLRIKMSLGGRAWRGYFPLEFRLKKVKKAE
ncbi:2-oxoglutarate and iron-dependent oxygenase domain-containing protein [Pseudanabaena yagii]|uniref:Non-haem dioxygenase N-terminal domain-containing protein n=1 Tax=Pseudanabaena yagii GIHE-NHR1 TaxID=2722753 RepID=A0ABX1M1X1_9CYAN|nr:2-oxoglutarate and iron-dependent oxygenase domain-containing protein [Pseudanabaena yagii]NMF61034.1 hypothetical protein [Pseudanabaena yagii GIHE-NHR1]